MACELDVIQILVPYDKNIAGTLLSCRLANVAFLLDYYLDSAHAIMLCDADRTKAQGSQCGTYYIKRRSYRLRGYRLPGRLEFNSKPASL